MTTNDTSIADAIAQFESDIGGGLPEETQPEAEVSEAENVDAEPEMESESDMEESESDESSEEDSEESAEDEPETELPDVEYVKADGKKVKVDFSDRDHIKRVYQKYVAQARYQSERDQARKELSEVKESAQKNQELVDILNEHIDDPAEMYRLFSGGEQKLDDLFKEWQKEQDQFALMSDAEKKAYLKSSEISKREKELAKKEAALERKHKEALEQEDKSNLSYQQSLVTSAFEKHRFNEITDPDKATRFDTRLWKDVKMALAEYESLNKEIVDKVVAEEAEALRKLISVERREETKKLNKDKKTKAKKAVAKAVNTKQEEEDWTKAGSLEDGLASLFKF